MRWLNIVPTWLLFAASATLADGPIWLDRFEPNGSDVPPPWRVVQLDRHVPPTRFRIIQWDGITAIEARADKSMALLARPVTIDLNRTPILCWRWRVDAPLLTADMQTRAGDDYAARVYVAFTHPSTALSLATRAKLLLARSLYGDAVPDAAINYVWDNRYPIGTRQPNAYTDRTQMVVAESGPARAGQWVVARHDVRTDFVVTFGTDVGLLTQLAVTADTDNTGEQARAGFADFHFVDRDAACAFD